MCSYIELAKFTNKCDWLYLPLNIMRIILSTSLPLLIAFFPAQLVRSIEKYDTRDTVKYLFLYLFVMVITSLLMNRLDSLVGIKNQKIDGMFVRTLNKYLAKIELKELNNYQEMNEIELLRQAFNKVGVCDLIGNLVKILSYFNIFLGTIVIMSNLGLGVFIAIVIALATNVYVEKKRAEQRKRFDDNHVSDRRAMEYSLRVYENLNAAKEIRNYQMSEFLYSKFTTIYKQYEEAYLETRRKRLIWYAMTFGTEAVRDYFVYFFLIVKLSRKMITVAEFALYTAAATEMYISLKNLFNMLIELNNNEIYYKRIAKILSNKDCADRGKITFSKIESIVFENVSFRYTEDGEYVLKNISFEVQRGERIGIVGVNGTGKTTILRLMLGLYEPTEGIILCNGIDIKQCDKKNTENYFQLFCNLYLLYQEP